MVAGFTITPHLSVHQLAFAPSVLSSRNLQGRGEEGRLQGWGLGSGGRPLPLTPALPQPAQAPPRDASKQEVLVNDQPTGTGAGEVPRTSEAAAGGVPFTPPVAVFQGGRR